MYMWVARTMGLKGRVWRNPFRRGHQYQPLQTAIEMADYEKQEATARTLSPTGEGNVLKTGTLAFVEEQGENGSKPMYQEASGAPVEASSPLGLGVG